MVETGGLENRCTGNRTGGSNPSPSAIDLIDSQTLSPLYDSFGLTPCQPIWGTIGEQLEGFRSEIPLLHTI